MEFIGLLFQEIFYRPLLNLLIWLYNMLPGGDFGVAIVVLTLLTKLIFYPFTAKSIRAQKTLQELAPQLKEIQEKYKKDRQKQAEATMAFYKQNNVSPFAGMLPLLIQLPILFALFKIITNVFNDGALALLYPLVQTPGVLNRISLGVLDLTATNNIVLGIIAGALTFWQIKMIQPTRAPAQKTEGKPDFQRVLQKQMLFMMPLMTAFFSTKFAAGLALYWIFTTIGTIVQQYIVQKSKTQNPKF
jgi:YidC/Oxa1 family membrane protein insertase